MNLRLLFLSIPLLALSFRPAAGAGSVHSKEDDQIIPFKAKLEKKTLTVKPGFLAVSHDRMVTSSILAEVGWTRVLADNTFNAVTDELDYGLKYGYGSGPFMLNLFLRDRVEFQKRLFEREFIGRERIGGMDFVFPFFFRTVGVTGLSGGEYTTIRSTFPLDLERRQTVMQKVSLGLYPMERGFRFTFRQGLRWLKGNYQYHTLQGEAGFRIPQSTRKWIFNLEGTAALPTRKPSELPLYRLQYLGGYETLRGWTFEELAGPSAVYGRADLRLPVEFGPPRSQRAVFWMSGFYLQGTLQGAAVGDNGVFLTRHPYRFSLSAGPGLNFGVRGGTVLYLEGMWAHPVHDRRKDLFYVGMGLR